MRVARRLEEVCGEHGVPPEGRGAIAALLGLLERDDTAPTTVREPERAVDVHVADALTGLEVPGLRAARRIADLGSGAGVPGLVLAAALPGVRVHLVESAGRKCAFLRRAVEVTGLPNVDVVHDRAETWGAGRHACDAVTARAVASLPVLVEYAAPLLTRDGVLVCWKGDVDGTEERDGAAAADLLGLESVGPFSTRPYRDAERHRLYVYLKVRPTPNGYPRRPGMARKRPIRA